jgi:hypothetical protein
VRLALAGDGVRNELETLLAGLGQALGAASSALADTYFMHVKVPHQLVGSEPKSS